MPFQMIASLATSYVSLYFNLNKFSHDPKSSYILNTVLSPILSFVHYFFVTTDSLTRMENLNHLASWADSTKYTLESQQFSFLAFPLHLLYNHYNYPCTNSLTFLDNLMPQTTNELQVLLSQNL